MLCKQETWPTPRWIADLNIPPALHFRCAVEDRDPVYSAEPVPTLVFGARCFSWEPDLWSRYGQIARGWHRAAEMGDQFPPDIDHEPFSPDGDYSSSRLQTCSLAWPAPATGYPVGIHPRGRVPLRKLVHPDAAPEQWPLSTRTYTNTGPQNAFG